MMKQTIFQLLFISCLSVSFFSCEKEATDNAKNEQAPSLYDPKIETAFDVEILYSEQANVRVKVNAPTLVRHKKADPITEFPDGIYINFINNSQNTKSFLTACHAIKYDRKQQIEVTDSVVVRTAKGDLLQTEKLIWNEKTRLIKSDGPVTIITATEEIVAQDFEANQDFTEYTFRNITGIKRLRRGQNK